MKNRIHYLIKKYGKNQIIKMLENQCKETISFDMWMETMGNKWIDGLLAYPAKKEKILLPEGAGRQFCKIDIDELLINDNKFNHNYIPGSLFFADSRIIDVKVEGENLGVTFDDVCYTIPFTSSIGIISVRIIFEGILDCDTVNLKYFQNNLIEDYIEFILNGYNGLCWEFGQAFFYFTFKKFNIIINSDIVFPKNMNSPFYTVLEETVTYNVGEKYLSDFNRLEPWHMNMKQRENELHIPIAKCNNASLIKIQENPRINIEFGQMNEAIVLHIQDALATHDRFYIPHLYKKEYGSLKIEEKLKITLYYSDKNCVVQYSVHHEIVGDELELLQERIKKLLDKKLTFDEMNLTYETYVKNILGEKCQSCAQ